MDDKNNSELVDRGDWVTLCTYINNLLSSSSSTTAVIPTVTTDNVLARAATGELLLDLVECIDGYGSDHHHHRAIDRSRLFLASGSTSQPLSTPQKLFNVETVTQAAQRMGCDLSGINLCRVVSER
jgi:hypothetical protein